MKEFVYHGKQQRLSKVMVDFYPLFSYNAILRLIKDKDLRIDGVKVSEDVLVNDGQVITSYAKDMKMREVYRDQNILVVYKPKGLLSEGDISAESIVKEYEKGAILCHRLDTNTDGILLFALTEKVANEIDKAFKEGKVEKVYEARVYGRLKEDVIFKDYLLKNSDTGRVKIFPNRQPGTQEVECRVNVVGFDGDTTIVEVIIHNGKTHQIRAQLANHGHFILGDSKYGRDDINRKYNIKKQQLTAKKLCFSLNQKSFLSYLNSKDISI